MERYDHTNENADEPKAEEGDSKSKKKRGVRAPIFFGKESQPDSKDAEEATPKPSGLEELFKPLESAEPGDSKVEAAELEEPTQELSLHDSTPESDSGDTIETQAELDSDGYMGELIIDHSDDGEDQEDHVHDIYAESEQIEVPAESQVHGEIPELIRNTLFELDPVSATPETPEGITFVEAAPLVVDEVPEAFQRVEQRDARVNSFDTSNMLNPNIATRHDTITEAEADDRAYRAEKRGLSRGVVSGGLVGWLIGRRVKKQLRAELDQTKKEQKKLAGELKDERFARKEEDKKHQSILARFKKEIRKLTHQEHHDGVTENYPLQTEAQETADTHHASEISIAAEQISQARRREALKQKPEELQSEDQADRIYAPPAGRRVETSAWHSIEVDEKTGHAAEDSAIEYGAAFRREQKQEKLNEGASHVQTAAFAGMTVLAADNTAPPANYSPAGDNANPNTASQSLRPKKTNKPIIDPSQLKQQLSDPIIWVFAVVIVFGIIAIAIIS